MWLRRRDDQSVSQWRIDAGGLDCYRCQWFLQLYESWPGHVQRAGSGSGRFDANRRQCRLHRRCHEWNQLDGNNFDNFANITISGTKYNDITGNSFTADDTGLGGVTINLYKNGGITPVATTVTAANGSYSFTNLGPGTYSVQEVVPAGSTQTGGNAGYTIIATSGTNSSGNNFDNFTNITISGYKYNDITGKVSVPTIPAWAA